MIIHEILNTYYNATNITTIYISPTLEVSSISKGISENHIVYLDFDEVYNFVKYKLKNEPIVNNTYYTFYTKNNFIYNTVFIEDTLGQFGAIITGAMMLSLPKESNSIKLIELHKSKLERSEIFKIINNIPVVTLTQVMSLGKLLLSLSKSIPSLKHYTQIRQYNRLEVQKVQELKKHINFTVLDETNYTHYSIFIDIKKNIINGDVKGLNELLDSIGDIQLDSLIKNDSLRSVKNNCIKISSFCCSAAIQSNAPYYQMMDFLDAFIRETENLNTLSELMPALRNIMEIFAHSVYVNSNCNYSAPIKKVLQYIQANYQNKITLPELSENVGLSPFYISTLIKKETHLSLADNINKVRIEKSKYLLLNTNASILDIAQSIGFTYQNHFASVFKKFMGTTPKEYRNNCSL